MICLEWENSSKHPAVAGEVFNYIVSHFKRNILVSFTNCKYKIEMIVCAIPWPQPWDSIIETILGQSLWYRHFVQVQHLHIHMYYVTKNSFRFFVLFFFLKAQLIIKTQNREDWERKVLNRRRCRRPNSKLCVFLLSVLGSKHCNPFHSRFRW